MELNPILAKSPWGADSFHAPKPWTELLGKSVTSGETSLEAFLESILAWSPVRRLEAIELLSSEFFDPIRRKSPASMGLPGDEHLAASTALPPGAAQELTLFDFTDHELGKHRHLLPQLLPLLTRDERRSGREGAALALAEAGRDEGRLRAAEPPTTQRSISSSGRRSAGRPRPPGSVRRTELSNVVPDLGERLPAGTDIGSSGTASATGALSDGTSGCSLDSFHHSTSFSSRHSSHDSAAFSAADSSAGSAALSPGSAQGEYDSPSHGVAPPLPPLREPREPIDSRIDAKRSMWRNSVREAQRDGTVATAFPTLKGLGAVPDTALLGPYAGPSDRSSTSEGRFRRSRGLPSA